MSVYVSPKSCWLSRKLNSKLLTLSSELSPQAMFGLQTPALPSSLHMLCLLTRLPKNLVRDSKRNLATYHKSASAGQNELCHQDVDVLKKTVITIVVKTCHPTIAFPKHLIAPGERVGTTQRDSFSFSRSVRASELDGVWAREGKAQARLAGLGGYPPPPVMTCLVLVC